MLTLSGDCGSSMHNGSTTSSNASSDVMTLTTTAASSWCAMPAGSRLRVLRLVRPHHRRMLVAPDANPSYGFAVRGGKEHGIGFFVSHIERNSEAELKGLRIGDQILRINGFRVDDAVHKEFIQFVSSQERIILKVRGIGMLPIKDKVDDRLSWHVVKIASVSNTPSESSYKLMPTPTATMSATSSSAASVLTAMPTTTGTTTATNGVSQTRRFAENRSSKDINVVLNVAPRTKLGLGICKGPEWKPGIFVQFTKEKSVAREVGLRPGDQILSVNSIDFADVLFSEAVAVMKSSSKLDMVVRTAAGCDLFPGESSGYNSSASSVTGDQSPCWADAKSKRLTSVREEPTGGAKWQPKAAKELNKTIIKLSENGTSINNTFVSDNHVTPLPRGPTYEGPTVACVVSNGAPPPPPPLLSNFNLCKYDEKRNANFELQRHVGQTTANGGAGVCSLQRNAMKTNDNCNGNNNNCNNNNYGNNLYKLRAPTTTTRQPTTTITANMNTSRPTIATTTTATATTTNSTSKSDSHGIVESSSSVGGGVGSILSSAINEELKKRKEKQQQQQQQRNSHADHNNRNNDQQHQHNHQHNHHHHHHNHHNHHQHHHQQQQQQPQQHKNLAHHNSLNNHTHNNNHNNYNNNNGNGNTTILRQVSKRVVISTPTAATTTTTATTAAAAAAASSSSSSTSSLSLLHGVRSAAGVAATNNSERNSSNNSNNNNNNNIVGVGDQHSALMDEFKRAHQRMFRNGFHETEHKEREETLKRTSLMADETCYRNKRDSVFVKQSNGNGNGNGNGTDALIPPPPPQFANVLPKQQQQHAQTTNQMENSTTQTKNITKPPTSPVPDYDHVQLRGATTATNRSVSVGRPLTNGVGGGGGVGVERRATLRLGTVVIGEYEQQTQQSQQQQREPGKLGFIASERASKHENLQTELQNTLTRSNLRQRTFEHQSHCVLQQQQQRRDYDSYEYNTNTNNNNAEVGNGELGSGIGAIARKLNGMSITNAHVQRQSQSGNNSGNNTGILKNGNGQRSNGGINGNSYAKSGAEKSIKFGN